MTMLGGAIRRAAPERSAQSAGRGLHLRFLLEGPQGAGVSTVMGQLADQGYTVVRRRPIGGIGVGVEWTTYATGRFEGEPIELAIYAVSSSIGPAARQTARTLADVIVLVVDSTPSGLARGASYVGDLRRRLDAIARPDRPDLMVLANKQDLPGARSCDEVVDALGLGPEVPRARTSIVIGGTTYAMAIATRASLVHVQFRDASGLPRRPELTLGDLAAALGDATAGDATAGSVPAGDVPAGDATEPAPAPSLAGGREEGGALAMVGAAQVSLPLVAAGVERGPAPTVVGLPQAEAGPRLSAPMRLPLPDGPMPREVLRGDSRGSVTVPPTTRKGALSRLISALRRSDQAPGDPLDGAASTAA